MIKLFVIVLAGLLSACYGEQVQPSNIGSRIVGGYPTDIADAPYMLSVHRSNLFVCGAVLISRTWALSAASCIYGRTGSRFSLMAGTTSNRVGGQLHEVTTRIIHHEYNPETHQNNNNICLLGVSTPFTLGALVQPVTLPAQGLPVYAGTYGVVSGWGHRGIFDLWGPEDLLSVNLPVMDEDLCNATSLEEVTSSMFCGGYLGGGKGACHLDAGGPFIVDDVLVGISSDEYSCGFFDWPETYNRVSAYRHWISAYTGI